jgi:hypothetical protein
MQLSRREGIDPIHPAADSMPVGRASLAGVVRHW